MNPIDKQLMVGMIDVLNNHSDILTEDQINIRLEDLKQFEEETGFVLSNSPTCKDEVVPLIRIKNIHKHNYIKCNDIDSIVKFADKNEMLVYLELIGTKVSVTYMDGIMKNFDIDNAITMIDTNKINNIPYKINKDKVYIVDGVLHGLDFYVTEVIEVGKMNSYDTLKEAEKLGFTVVPNWLATNFDLKNLQSNLEYVYDYAEEEGFKHNGVVFRFNDISYSQDGIVYEMLNK